MNHTLTTLRSAQLRRDNSEDPEYWAEIEEEEDE